MQKDVWMLLSELAHRLGEKGKLLQVAYADPQLSRELRFDLPRGLDDVVHLVQKPSELFLQIDPRGRQLHLPAGAVKEGDLQFVF